jgi:hypothetical protein
LFPCPPDKILQKKPPRHKTSKYIKDSVINYISKVSRKSTNILGSTRFEVLTEVLLKV